MRVGEAPSKSPDAEIRSRPTTLDRTGRPWREDLSYRHPPRRGIKSGSTKLLQVDPPLAFSQPAMVGATDVGSGAPDGRAPA